MGITMDAHLPIAAPSSSAAPEHVDRYAHKWLIAAGVTLAAVMELLDTSIVNVALNQMSANLGATLDDIAWVSTAYILAAVIVLPMTGWFSTFFGRKRYFMGSIVIFTIASFLCGQSSSLIELVLWRVLQGVGGGALIATSQAILAESFPPDQQTVAAAIFGLGMMVGPALGPTLGGVIVDRYNWPWIFYINLPFGMLATYMTYRYVNDSASQKRSTSIDVVGMLLIALGIGSLQFVLERGQHYDWLSAQTIRILIPVSVGSLLLMLWWELRVANPILNLRILKNRSLSAGSAFAAVLGLALYGSIFALPIYVQQLLGYDAETAGWILFPGAVGSAVALIMIARFSKLIPDLRYLIVIGAALVAYSMYMHGHFTTLSGPHNMLWPVVIRGFGTGCMFVPLATSAIEGLSGAEIPQGTAIFNLTRQLGGSIGIAFLATELTRRGSEHRADLVSMVGSYDPTTVQRLTALTRNLIAKGYDPYTAKQTAYQILDLTVQRQAIMLAFRDIFYIVGILMLLAIPLIFVLRKPGAGALHMGE